MAELDLTPAAHRMADLISAIPDERLDAPTPCSEATVGDLVDHVGGLPGREADREGLFGPPVEVPDEAPLLDRVIGLTGRDPAWSPR